MEPFYETHFIKAEMSHLLGLPEEALMWPYRILTMIKTRAVTDAAISPDELAVRRGGYIVDYNGEIVGSIDEFLVNPETGYITHLVLAQGYFWGKRKVTIPVYEIDQITENQVQLKLDKNSIMRLPAISARR